MGTPISMAKNEAARLQVHNFFPVIQTEKKCVQLSTIEMHTHLTLWPEKIELKECE